MASTTTSKTTPSKPHKRQLSSSATQTTGSTPGSRQSKRIRASAENTSKTNGARSKYFKGSNSDSDGENKPAKSSQVSGEDSSDYEDEDDYDSEDALKKSRVKGKQAGRSSSATTTTTTGGLIEKGKELWRQGVKAGLGPGKAVFIEKPKPRGDGGIKYVPGKIHPNTMAFLADLKVNNEREWMKMHDADYRTSWKDWESFVESLTEKIVEKDDTIPELPPKDLVFRVYRDIRFTPDPTPYKPFFSAAWSRTGRKGPYAGYYVQIAPGGKTFVGSGLWMPEAAPLSLLRAEIDRNSHRMKRVLLEPGIRKEMFGGIPGDEKKAVKAFVSQNGENALKTKPKGFEADNPNIELLRLRNFTMGKKLKDEEVVGAGFLDRVADLVGIMAPFVTYLNSVIMPDDDHDDDNDNDTPSEVASDAEDPEQD